MPDLFESILHVCVDTRGPKRQYECVNRNFFVLIGLAVIAIVGILVWVLNRPPDCEPEVVYVLKLKDALLADEEGFVAAIKTQNPGKKAIFRHSLRRHLETDPTPTVPPGYEDDGVGSHCERSDSRPPGMHVTQSIGFNSLENLQKVLEKLKD